MSGLGGGDDFFHPMRRKDNTMTSYNTISSGQCNLCCKFSLQVYTVYTNVFQTILEDQHLLRKGNNGDTKNMAFDM